jgi:hypothetical protein
MKMEKQMAPCPRPVSRDVPGSTCVSLVNFVLKVRIPLLPTRLTGLAARDGGRVEPRMNSNEYELGGGLRFTRRFHPDSESGQIVKRGMSNIERSVNADSL